MNCWQDLPKELQLRDGELESLTLQDVSKLYKLANELQVLDQFTNLFWSAMERVRNRAGRASIQQCVELLEERKRTLGRCFNHNRNIEMTRKFFAIRYNECEYNIRWLVEQYECHRKTEPYLLEV